MKADLYTKFVLTVIAIALVCIVFQNFNVIPTAQASTPLSNNSTIVNKSSEVIDVRIVGYSSDDKVPVEILYPIRYSVLDGPSIPVKEID